MPHPATTRLILTAMPCLVLVLGGCSRAQQERITKLERDNRRLSSELSATTAENRVLEIQNQELERRLAAEERAGATTSPQGSDPVAADELQLPAVEGAETSKAGAAATGDWVVVLASVVGDPTASRPGFEEMAADLNRRHGAELGPLFALRTPRSGGLQLVFGADGSGNGISKARAQEAITTLDGRYADAFLLNIR